MKKSIFTLLLSGLAMAGFVHAASPLGGEAMSPKAEEEPAYDWYVVDSNRMSGVTADDVDDEGVLGYASVPITRKASTSSMAQASASSQW